MPAPLSGTQFTLTRGDDTVVVASIGASLRSFQHAGRNLVVPYEADELRPGYRGVTLVPWPNRVVDGRYTFAGQEQQLPLTEPSRGHALHGLGVWLDYRAVAVAEDRVQLEAVIEAQTGYPWRLRIETTFTLTGDGLVQRVRATNLSDAPAPFGTGPHPYLVAGEGRVDDWTLELPAASVLHVDERLAPTVIRPVDDGDPQRFDFRIPRTIADAEIDHAYTDLQRNGSGITTVRLMDAAGRGVAMAWDAACPWVQIHTADLDPANPAHRAGLAVEPMTCAPDAFNAPAYPFDTGLVVIEPGQSFEAGWTIGAIA
jgi:aldose 1-epimerase